MRLRNATILFMINLLANDVYPWMTNGAQNVTATPTAV